MRHYSYIVTLMAGLIGSAQANDYFPIQSGDTATYANVTFGQEAAAAIEVAVTAQSGRHWKQVNHFLGQQSVWLWSQPDSNKLYLFDPQAGPQLLIDFDAAAGTQFSARLSACDQQARVAEKTAYLPAGNGGFYDVIRVEFSGPCQLGGISSAWFARDLGLVQWQSAGYFVGAAVPTYRLQQAQLQGVMYPETPGLSYSVELPSAAVELTETASLPVYLTLTNATTSPLQLQFASMQHFDVELSDQQGQLLYRWSDGKFFAQALNTVTLEAGHSRRFGTRLALSEPQLAGVTAGSYTLTLRFLGNTTTVPTAAMTFTAPIQMLSR